jgi:hypothetical protein
MVVKQQFKKLKTKTTSQKPLCRIMDVEGTPEIKLNFGRGITWPKILPNLLIKARHLFPLGAKNLLLSVIKHKRGNYGLLSVIKHQ